MSSLVLKSAAKVNLYLKVLNQREDGFHNIETLFQRIDLCDELTFHKNASGRITITCSHPHVPEGPKNLVYKVAQKFKDDFGIKEGIHIDIKKSIPVAAGLAGGSTNAATALIALNQLWDIGLTRESLVEYAIGIGSDVAFFLYDTSFAIGTDRGHVLETVDIKQKYYYILVTPKIKVYAKDAYQELALSRKIAIDRGEDEGLKERKVGGENVLTNKGRDVNILIRNLENSNFSGIASEMTNDLQSAVISLCPGLQKTVERLKSLSTNDVMVSGSGPSVFSLMMSEDEALRIKKELVKKYSQVYVVKTL